MTDIMPTKTRRDFIAAMSIAGGAAALGLPALAAAQAGGKDAAHD